MPRSASTTAITTSSLLLEGTWNPLPPPWPAQATNTKSSKMCITPPAAELRPTPVTAWAGGMPAFCMKRTLRAIPPTLAGVTRLTKDEAICACRFGQNGSGWGTPPARPMADAAYVSIDITAATSSQPQLAERMAWTLSSTLASCGSRM